MPDTSAEEVRDLFRPAFEKAWEIAAFNRRSTYEHLHARRAAEAIERLVATITGDDRPYPSNL